METFLAANASVAGFILYNSLRAVVLIVLVLLVQRVLVRQLSASGRYLLWLAVVISLVTPVGFNMTIPRLPVLMSEQTQPVTAAVGNPLAFEQQTITQNTGVPGVPALTGIETVSSVLPNGISLAEALSLLWLVGVLLFMGVVLIRHFRFVAVVRAAVPADATLQALLEQCRQQTNCQRAVTLLCSSDIDSPLIAGYLRPCLLLPIDTAGQLNEEQLRHVFLHELMHVKNHDIACNWLLALLQALHWFNPLVWLGFSQLRFDRELARDAETLGHLQSGDDRDYGRTLLQLSQPDNRRPQTAGVLGIVDDHAQLRRRIAMIAQNSLPLRFQTRLAGALLLVLGTIAFSKPALDATGEIAAAQSVAMAPVALTSAVTAVVPNSNPVPELTVTTITPAPTMPTLRKPVVIARPAAPIAATPETSAAADLPEPVLTVAMADINTMPPTTAPEPMPIAVPKTTTPAQTAPEEIVIVGRSLREKMLNAEVTAYEIFNKFNDDKMFRISCLTYAPTGTRFTKQSCKPEFEITALKDSGRGYLENMQSDVAGSASPALREPLEVAFARYLPRYQRKMQQVAAEHPEFLQAIIRYNKLRDEYLGLNQSEKR